MKATEKYFPVVLFIILCRVAQHNVIIKCDCAYEIVKCDHFVQGTCSSHFYVQAA